MRHAADRLCTGHAILARRVGRRLAAWVAAGRRPDLTGWRTALGPLARSAVLLAAGYAVARIIRAVPGMLWVLTPAWLIAAYRAGKPAATAAAPAPVEGAPDPPARNPAEDVRAMLLGVLGDRPAVHLSEVLAHLQEQGQWEGKTVRDLRARLEALGIPVQPKLKIGGVPTRGVLRSDLLAPPRSAAEAPSPAMSTAV